MASKPRYRLQLTIEQRLKLADNLEALAKRKNDSRLRHAAEAQRFVARLMARRQEQALDEARNPGAAEAPYEQPKG